MSTFESSYKSLLQGVSQQIPSERLPGQLTAQTNMVSDPVTNLRRRPGAMYEQSVVLDGSTPENTVGWFTDIAGKRLHVLLCTTTGEVKLLDTEFEQVAALSSDYLIASSTRSIRAATVGNEFFMCNTEVVPTISGSSGTQDPSRAGFFYGVAGSFGRQYTITVKYDSFYHVVFFTCRSG